jgi:hypothetical protein
MNLPARTNSVADLPGLQNSTGFVCEYLQVEIITGTAGDSYATSAACSEVVLDGDGRLIQTQCLGDLL